MTHRPDAYDNFADIYDVWVETAPVTAENAPFYVEEYLRAEEPVVELGVGNGRIMIEAAKRGRAVIGVDISPKMLQLAADRAGEAGVNEKITLVQADFRDFTLPEPAALVAIPFHTIGHMVTLEDKRAAFAQVHSQLRPGGHLIFDHFVFDPDLGRERDGRPMLRAEFTDPATGRDVLLWVTSRINWDRQTMRLICWTDELDADDLPVKRRYRRMDFSWIDPDQVKRLLLETGFEVESLYGDFKRGEFTNASHEQVWVARKG